MRAIEEVLSLSAEFLRGKGVAHPRRMAEELLSHVLGLRRIELYMQFDRPLLEEELEKYREYVRRKAAGEPWQYIVGEIEFFGCRIEVNRSVLIPRQESEILVSKIVEILPKEPLEIWDVCCGSGCLGIALKKACPLWNVTLSDISKEALETAKRNVFHNDVLVDVCEGDFLEPFTGRKADVIVCNPPYVTHAEYAVLDREVKDFEPRLALVGEDFYERLSREAPALLKSNGKIFLEVGAGMGERVMALFDVPSKQVMKDWAGHDRFVFLEFQ